MIAIPMWSLTARCDDQQLLQVISRAGPQGRGSAEAREARNLLAKRGTTVLPALLVAMDTENPVAANWYRTIYEEIVARQLMDSDVTWPVEFMKNYVSDGARAGRPRRLVLKLIDRLEPNYRDQWLPKRLADPEFRDDAVALVLREGDEFLRDDDREAALTRFSAAFENARSRNQVIQAAERLKSLGEDADVISHLGLVTSWMLVGPFDAPGKSGFSTSLSPETHIDLRAEYTGQKDQRFGWVGHTTADPLGQLNLVSVLGRTDEAVAYAWTEITVEQQQMVQLRCSADDCCLVWLNGDRVSEHEQWLNGTRFDRFVDEVTLKSGRNKILVKVCQGPQHRNPEVFNNWSLQLRLCDENGRGIAFRNTLPSEGIQ